LSIAIITGTTTEWWSAIDILPLASNR